jgi:hypothetical protein
MRRRPKWQRDEEEIKAGKVRPVLRAALRDGKKAEAALKKIEEQQKKAADDLAALQADCDANAKEPDKPDE